MLHYYHVTLLYYRKLFLSNVAHIYIGKFVSLMKNQRVGIFPPKSKILFHLSPTLIRCLNFQDWAFPVGGDTRPSFRKRRICFPHRKSASWNFPAKTKNSLLPGNIFHLMWKIQDWPSPLGGVTWSKYAEWWPVRRKEEEEEKEKETHMRTSVCGGRSQKPR